MSQDTDKTSRTGVILCNQFFTQENWTFNEQFVSDFGIDVHVETKEEGRPTGRLLALQIKSGNSFFKESCDEGWVHRLTHKHKTYWINYSLPVVLVLVDCDDKIGYWVELTPEIIVPAGENYKVKVPRNQKLDKEGFRKLRELASAQKPTKERVLSNEDFQQVFETEDFKWLPAATPEGFQHYLYPKSTNASLEFSMELISDSRERFKDFLEKGTGGVIEGVLSTSNFLPEKFRAENTVVKVTLEDRSLPELIPVIFHWRGHDGYVLNKELTLQCKRFGSKEALLETTLDQRDFLKILVNPTNGKLLDASFDFPVAGSLIGKALDNLRFFISTSTGTGKIRIFDKGSTKLLLEASYQDEREDDGFKLMNSYDILQKCEFLSDVFSQPMKVPKDWFADSDVADIIEIYEIVATGVLKLGNCTVTVPVGPDLADRMFKEVDGSHNAALTQERQVRSIADYKFDLGPSLTVIYEPLVIRDEVEGEDPIKVPLRSRIGEVTQFFENYRPKKQ